jgi:hypothetical protein
MKRKFKQLTILVVLAVALIAFAMITVASVQSYALAHEDMLPDQAPLAQATREKLSVTTVSSGGVTETLASPSALTMAFTNNGFAWMEVTNLATTSKVITVETPGNVGGLEIEDLTVTIPGSVTYKIGPFINSLYNRTASPDKGYVYITFPETSTLSVGVFKIR